MKIYNRFILMLILILLSFNIQIVAQISGKAVYSTIMEEHNYKEMKGTLFFNQTHSFFSVDGESVIKEYKEMEELELIDEQNMNLQFRKISPGSLSSIYSVYINKSDQEILRKSSYFKNGKFQPCIIVESLGLMNWEILKEKKMIGSFQAIKATTTFRGRNYTAWFSREIPVNIGPWAFHGLPGLILEIYDDKNEVQFLLSSIEIPYDLNSEDIRMFDIEERVTIEQFIQYQENTVNEFIQLIMSKLPRGTEVSDVSVTQRRRGIELEY